MENTFRRVVGNSATGEKVAFGDFLKEAGQGVTVPAEVSAIGLLLRGGKKALEKVTGSNNEAKAARFADDLGRLSIAGGAEADALIAAILKRQGKAANNEAFNEFAGRLGTGAARADDPLAAKSALIAALMGRDYVRAKAEPRR